MSPIKPNHPIGIDWKWLIGVAITIVTLTTSFSLNVNERLSVVETKQSNSDKTQDNVNAKLDIVIDRLEQVRLDQARINAKLEEISKKQ